MNSIKTRLGSPSYQCIYNINIVSHRLAGHVTGKKTTVAK